MLILPIENKPDWSHPPVVTIALILVNLLVFVLYQGQDEQILQQAERIYIENHLLEIDREYYFDYLADESPEIRDDLRDIPSSLQIYMLTQYIFFDRGFDQYLRQQEFRGMIPDTEEYRNWRQARDDFEQQRNQSSWVRGGLTPAEAKPITFVTNMFLHGSWDHLLGNMAFLFLFGFTLESVLRAHSYLLLYLACGLAANLLHLSFNLGSYIPVVGASGAVSGLMGMYLALYRLRRIRFFYAIFFYFGEFRAPALLILPAWLAKELYGHFFTDTNIAYWAHIGGLLAGAGLMFFARNSHRQLSSKLQHKEKVDRVEGTQKRIQSAMAALDAEKAKTLARGLCQTHPTDPRPWRTLFDLHKGQPAQRSFHETTFALLKQFAAEESDYREWRHPVEEILEIYRQLHPKAPALNGPISLALARKYWRNGNQPEAEAHLQRALDKGVSKAPAAQLIREMSERFRQRGQTDKAAHYAGALRQLMSDQ